MDDSSTRSWDAIADEWVRHADTNDYRNQFLMPRMLRWVDERCAPLAGKRVLDLGCGDGAYARELSRRGATVTGVDGSARLIEIARERSGGLELVVANAARLPLPDASFEVIVAPMSMMDFEDYGRAIAECRRVLVPGGTLFMSILHPCFTMQGASWMRDGRALMPYSVDHYFNRTPWEEIIAEGFRTPVLRHHRTLQDYFNGALAAGLQLAELIEPTPTADELALSPRFLKLQRIPYFLFLRFRNGQGAFEAVQ